MRRVVSLLALSACASMPSSGGKLRARDGEPLAHLPHPAYEPTPPLRKRKVPKGRVCAGRPMPSGAHLREWMQVGGPSGPMGCPKTAVREIVTGSPQGSVVEFDNGQISVSPDGGDERVLAAYQDGTGIRVDWAQSLDHPRFNYDKFVLRWDINGQHREANQVDVLADISQDQTIAVAYARTWQLENGHKLVLRDTHLRTKGQEMLVADHGSGIYRISVLGCDMRSVVGVDHETVCNNGWYVPVDVKVHVARDPKDASKLVAGDDVTTSFFQTMELGPPATSLKDAKARLEDRAAQAVLAEACRILPPHNYRKEMSYAGIILAKLAFSDYFDTDRCPGRDVDNRDEAFASLLDQSVDSRTGTTVETFFKGGFRTGEYDSALIALIPVMYRYHRVLPPGVFDHVLFNLLSTKGKVDPNDHLVHGVVEETENHVLMIESSRYLANQLLFLRTSDPAFDNTTNGNDEWMLDYLAQFLRRDFKEYNAKPYQNYSLAALQNLASYANDKQPSSRRVQVAARMVLDYVSSKISVSSNDSRRSVPYRRRVSRDRDDFFANESDPNTARSLLFAGTTDALPNRSTASHSFAYPMMMAALSEYRVPDAILDLMVYPEHRRFVQRFNHYAEELYAGSPSYLLSAGGHYATYAYVLGELKFTGSDDDIGFAVPTMLLPTGHQGIGRDAPFATRAQLIRFKGARDHTKRSNMCVAQDFACGLDPVIPASYSTRRPARCMASADERGAHLTVGKVDAGPWHFFDESGECAREPGSRFGYYVAVYTGADWGFLETVDTVIRRDLPFAAFTTEVLRRNAGKTFTPDGVNTYRTTGGDSVEFIVAPDSRIVRAPNQPAGRAAAGTIVNSAEQLGKVTIDNPVLGRRIILDDSDPHNPQRIEQ